MLLELKGLSKSFGGLEALNGVSFTVEPGVIQALIGPNGAGKTTCFNLISGILPPTAGAIRFAGQDLTRLSAYQRARLGLARTFQNVQLFSGMTVLENVLVGQHIHFRAGLLATLANLPAVQRQERHSREVAEELLAFVGLAEKKGLAGRQPGLRRAAASGNRPGPGSSAPPAAAG